MCLHLKFAISGKNIYDNDNVEVNKLSSSSSDISEVRIINTGCDFQNSQS